MRDVDECFFSPALFVERHCQIYDATDRVWMPFALWPAQRETLRTMHDNRLTVILKARQLGLTWLVLAYALWLICLFFTSDAADDPPRLELRGRRSFPNKHPFLSHVSRAP